MFYNEGNCPRCGTNLKKSSSIRDTYFCPNQDCSCEGCKHLGYRRNNWKNIMVDFCDHPDGDFDLGLYCEPCPNYTMEDEVSYIVRRRMDVIE